MCCLCHNPLSLPVIPQGCDADGHSYLLTSLNPSNFPHNSSEWILSKFSKYVRSLYFVIEQTTRIVTPHILNGNKIFFQNKKKFKKEFWIQKNFLLLK